MAYAIIGLVIGILIGIFTPFTIPVQFARYTAIGILGILDSLLGAVRADLQKQYNNTIFISGLLFNLVVAVVITLLGDRLGLDLYLAAIIVFTFRIFANLAKIRYTFLTPFLGKKRVEQELKEE